MNVNLFLYAALLSFAASVPAHGQVIEIDSVGEARTFVGPTIFTATAAVPIELTRVSIATAADSTRLIADAARVHGLEPGLLQALAWQESRGRMSAISPKGALGVMQLMPATAAELGVRPLDLGDNIRGGALYLRRQLDRFGGNVPLALAAYNAGPGAVSRHGGIPPYRETRNYVANILARWRPVAPSIPANPSIVEVTP